jgi:hypothetical protein
MYVYTYTSSSFPTINAGFGCTSSSAQASCAANSCVYVLSVLSSMCPHGLMEASSELQEAFISLPNLHHETAGKLILALGPLFQSSNSLADKCSLAVRKSSFSKDSACRQAAVSALLSLLRSQMIQATSRDQNSSASSSASSSSSASKGIGRRRGMGLSDRLRQQGGSGLSLEEVIALLKRFLQHQSAVRGIYMYTYTYIYIIVYINININISIYMVIYIYV